MSQNKGFGENIEDYDVLELLGKGGFATVYKGRSKGNNQMVAIKMIDKKLIHSAGLTNRVRQEVEIHSRLKHPFVVELYTFFQDADYVYLVMELASNGELQRYIKEHLHRPMTEDEAATILQQVVSGILYLHSHRIMHRDISLSNLLLSKNMDVKIADFGLATQLKQSDEKHLTMCGTPNFISPEVASRSSHGLPADVWAVGCLLYTLLVGKPPFDTHAVQATLTKVVMSDYLLPEHLSYEAKDLISKLLKKDPNERMPLQNIVKHPFMQRYKSSSSSSPAAAAGTVAIQSFKGINGALRQNSTPNSGYNSNSSASCDSGILTFASNSSCSSFRPGFRLGGGTAGGIGLINEPIEECEPMEINNYQSLSSNYEFHGDSHWSQPQDQHETPSSMGFHSQQQQNNFYQQKDPNLIPSHRSVESSSQMIAGIPTATPKASMYTTNSNKNNNNSKDQRLSVPALNTDRLQPTRFRNKNAIMSILQGGEVVVEFIKFRGKLNEDRITDICWISKDGQRIVIYEPDPGRGLPISDEPPELPQQDTRLGIFSYDNLPSKHWRKYLFASRFVSLVKASTPKVTYFSEQAKFHLMESMVHFEAIFYDGSKVTQSPNEGLKVYDRHGRLLQPQEHSSSTARALLEHQSACLRHCEAICNALELIQSSSKMGDNFTCFPVIIGRRPQKDRHAKLNEGPSQMRETSNVMRVRQSHQHSQQQQIDMDMVFNTFSSSNNTPRENDNKARPMRTAFVPGIGKATELSNGIYQVQFNDGSIISLASTNATAARMHKSGITFIQPNGIATHFAPHDELPLAVREKLQHLPNIEEHLRNSFKVVPNSHASSLYSEDINCSPISTKFPRAFTSTPASFSAHNRVECSSASHNSHAMRYFR